MKGIRRTTFHLYGVGLLALLCASGLGAQTFDSGSNGSDGALDFTGQTGTIVFDPTTFNPSLDPDGDGVYHFTTIKVPNGLTVRLTAAQLGVKPVVWLATGNIEIRGILDLNGATGHIPGGPHVPAAAGAGGYAGGVGESALSPAGPGLGPGGALGAGGGAGHAVSGGGGSGIAGVAYGNSFLLPQLGGSGGAGGQHPSLSSGGGGGGGAILLASSGEISITGAGAIFANGGAAGCGGGSTAQSGGGGGSGGSIRLIARSLVIGSVSIHANGGGACAGLGSGSRGRIRLEAYNFNVGGNVSPAPTTATPSLIFPPASAPSVRITSIGGTAVPASPTGSFINPDVTLDDATTVTIQLAASKVPVGTIVKLTLTPETGAIQRVDSTPLAGTFESSTATATVTLPHGFSRFSVQASWTP